jgi:hypothetical protein
LPATALCSALAEVFTWLTDDTTAWTVVREGRACADVTADCRPDSELRSGLRRVRRLRLAGERFRVRLDFAHRSLHRAEVADIDGDIAQVLNRGLSWLAAVQ